MKRPLIIVSLGTAILLGLPHTPPAANGQQDFGGSLKTQHKTVGGRGRAKRAPGNRGPGSPLRGTPATQDPAVQQAAAPWWEAETAMGPGGTLLLSGKPWWDRAGKLEVGEQFALQSEHPGRGQMLVRRERVTRRGGKQADAIVWVLDDDGDFQPGDRDGDKDSDCYVVDYDADGRVDRLVDYIDDDSDGVPDEMDIRYFQDGRLRRSWFGLDLDEDGRMWDLTGYEYSGDFFRSDPYGNSMIYMNEYDPDRNQWVPSCECPFAFFDTDGDGQSEVTIRASGVPLEFDPWDPFDMDYGNAVFGYTGPFTERMRHPGAVNIRYSRDVDGLSSAERPLHYDMGFNLIGRVPYEFDRMARQTPLRRPPKVTKVIPHEDLIRAAETYPAERTGFSWREYGDDAVALGAPPHPEEDRRWEGVFWTWSRRFMHNTGGPIQNWNMRREFRPTPSDKRELYYCRADHRIHLKGATDGWIRVGHLGDDQPWGEIRMFDTDRDGYFDRWETHRAGKPPGDPPDFPAAKKGPSPPLPHVSTARPSRVSTVRDAGIRDLPSDWDEVGRVYTQELLPEALEANEELMAAMSELVGFQLPENLAKALDAATCDSERLYVQDIIRETQYLMLREELHEQSARLFAAFPAADLHRRPDELRTSIRAWTHARLMADLDAAYAEGRYGDALRLLREIAKAGEAETWAAQGSGRLGRAERERDRASVSGTVVIDGKPLAKGRIRFVPQTGVRGGVDAVILNGRYDFDDGLPPGPYEVQVFSHVPGDGPGAQGAVERIPPRYNVESELLVEVMGGHNTFDFHLQLR